ncbi:MAG: YciI family protein [Saprospiraceae bacterium]
MKEYMFLFRGGNDPTWEQSPAEAQTNLQLWFDWMANLQANGQLAHAQPLDKGGQQISGKDKHVSNGPFTEGNEAIGGYLICRAENYQSALEIAKDCPILSFDDGKVEIREIMEMT